MSPNDFTKFSARAYLAEYYSNLNPENKFLLSFYNNFYRTIPKVSRMIEVGGGPTIYQLISASGKVGNIIFSEFVKENRDEVVKFLSGDHTAWNWDTYISYVLEINDKIPTPELIETVKNQIRKKVSHVIPCDIRKKHPLAPSKYSPFELLSMGSVVDSVAATEKEFISYFKNSLSLLKKDGFFVGFFAKNFTTWTQLDLTFYLFPVDENYIRNIFPKFGLKITEITTSVPPDYQQEYEGIFAVSAIKIS